MYKDPNRSTRPVCNFIPSYSRYDGVAGSFAAGLSNCIEMILSLIGGLRR